MIKKLPIPQAMMWKYGAKCSKNEAGDDIAVWEHPTEPKPNRIQIIKDLAEYEKHLKENEYKEKRREEYPSIEDQLDCIWKGGEDMETMRKKIMQIKSKYPKPERVK